MTWHPPKGPKGPIKKARAKRKRKDARMRKKTTGIQNLRILNPPAHGAKAKSKIMEDWTRHDIESAILSTASRSTDLRRFKWLVYGQKNKDESLVITVLKSLGIKRPMMPSSIDRYLVSRVAFDLDREGHLVCSSRWGWRAR